MCFERIFGGKDDCSLRQHCVRTTRFCSSYALTIFDRRFHSSNVNVDRSSLIREIGLGYRK
jgi:hypothetical protein